MACLAAGCATGLLSLEGALPNVSYVVVEELVAIIDPRTRKVEIVFPRWGKQ